MPMPTCMLFLALALIAGGFVALAGWPAAAIVGGIVLIILVACGYFG